MRIYMYISIHTHITSIQHPQAGELGKVVFSFTTLL